MRTMRALVFHGPGDLRLEDVPEPTPAEGEVLVQVEVALTDGTDLKAYRRGHPVLLGPPPSPFGHEVCGIDVATGRRVVVANSAPCGACAPCARGQETLCENLFPLLNGAYAELLLVPARIARRNLLPVPPGLASEVAAMAEPLACCLHGVDVAGVQHGDTVAIVGAGPIGLMLCACVADAGGRPALVGGRPERRELAPLFGATRRRRRAPTSSSRPRAPGGVGPALELVRPGGTVLAFGGLPGGCARRDRPVPDPLRGGSARRRVPPHPAPVPGRARVPRERRVSLRAAGLASRRARGRRGTVRRPAARLPQGRGSP